MTSVMPSPGDFVVEYRGFGQSRGASRVVVVQITPDAGPEEVFASCLAGSGARAERLAATWALEDGTAAWTVIRSNAGRPVFTRLSTDVTAASDRVISLGGSQA